MNVKGFGRGPNNRWACLHVFVCGCIVGRSPAVILMCCVTTRWGQQLWSRFPLSHLTSASKQLVAGMSIHVLFVCLTERDWGQHERLNEWVSVWVSLSGHKGKKQMNYGWNCDIIWMLIYHRIIKDSVSTKMTNFSLKAKVVVAQFPGYCSSPAIKYLIKICEKTKTNNESLQWKTTISYYFTASKSCL